jgi:hypothetical protein
VNTRRLRAPAVVGGVLLVAAAVTALTGGEAETSARLDPANPGPDGARAVARVLEDQGVSVRVARDADELEAEPIGVGSTVVVTSAGDLGASTLRRLLDHAGAADVLVVEPPTAVVEELDEGMSVGQVGSRDRVWAGCHDPLLEDLRVAVDDAVGFTGAGQACFELDSAAVYAVSDGGVALLGAGSVLTNDQVTRADNAAVALRLLGQEEHLVWYVPDPADLAAGDELSLASQLPRWIKPALGLLVTVGIALLVWRGRRLGPLVTEPLPVTVRSIESTHGRGQLYRRADARAHAGQVLLGATRARLAQRLRLPRTDPDPDHLVQATAAATGRPPAEVGALLYPPFVPTGHDRELIALARQLTALEEEVDQRP